MATSRKTGSKLNRSEIVQVRFDPKLRIAAELAAAKERRSLSSLVEWAVQRVIPELMVTTQDGRPISAAEVAETTWDVEEADRFVKRATLFPELLTYDEQRLWRAIREVDFSTTENRGRTELRYRLFVDGKPKWKAIRKIWPRLKSMLDTHTFSLNSELDSADFEGIVRRLLDAGPVAGIEPEVVTIDIEASGNGT